MKHSVVTQVLELLRASWEISPRLTALNLLVSSIPPILAIASATIMKYIFDGVAQGSREEHDQLFFLFLLVMLLIILLGKAAVMPLNQFLFKVLEREVSHSMKMRIMRRLGQFVSLRYYTSPRFYDTLLLAQQGAEVGPLQVPFTIATLLQSAITVVGFVSILVAVSPTLIFIVAMVATLQFYAQLGIASDRYFMGLETSSNERKEYYLRNLLADPTAIGEIKLLALDGFILERYENTLSRIRTQLLSQFNQELRKTTFFQTISGAASGLAFAFVCFKAFEGNYGLGDLSLYMNSITGLVGGLSGLSAAAANLKELTLLNSHLHSLENLGSEMPLSALIREVPSLSERLEFVNVSFRYAEDQPWILKNLNLRIDKGSSLALLGLNGVGKSTLVKLLCRLHEPSKGRILWNDSDISTFDVHRLRQRMSVLLQEFNKYEFSIEENIRVGDFTNTDPNIIVSLIDEVGLSYRIAQLPEGVETVAGYRFAGGAHGIGLSGGEWQKIGLARLLLRDAELYVLDEPTSSLDIESEFLIIRKFLEATKEKTRLIITHRFSTALLANEIALLSDGRIVERGTHKTLMRLNGVYARLYGIYVSSSDAVSI